MSAGERLHSWLVSQSRPKFVVILEADWAGAVNGAAVFRRFELQRARCQINADIVGFASFGARIASVNVACFTSAKRLSKLSLSFR